MALQWTTAIRDLVSVLALGKTYTNLRTEEKAYLDATNTPAVPTSSPGGVASHAITRVRQYAQWFEEAGTGTSAGPDVWEQVFVAETALQCAKAFRRAEIPQHLVGCKDAWEAALDSFSVTDASSVTVASQTLTWKSLRLHVLRHCLRRVTQRTRLFPSPAAIDTAIQWARTHLWNRSLWEFRTRQVTITITTNANGSSPSLNLPAGETFDSIACRWLIHDSDTDSTQLALPADRRISYVTGTEMAALKAQFGSTTGRPQYFHIEDRGNGARYWHWAPAPDAEYTVKGAVAIALPATPSDATANAAFSPFGDAQTVLPDLVLAKVLKDHAAPGWAEAWKTAMDQAEVMVATMDSQGVAANEGITGTDVYMDDVLGSRMGGEGL